MLKKARAEISDRLGALQPEQRDWLRALRGIMNHGEKGV